ncbi:type III-B CRISPR module-associated protein Cmr5 [Nitratireductor sp. XY-223]|uniref:type III-B CRISPR module-associated protein Cmr5 n=1 Tax=Nitratireductor sp. XY-223 TaxID=2561926 RepID=UPI0010AB153F|nr:type III-B CRISPR module-associated protein Cmr5 [Nitratireductor sp. XY-223]
MDGKKQTLEQRRAEDAWCAVQDVVRETDGNDDVKDYGREAKRLPVRIATAGLGHALAFAAAKGGAKAKVANKVADWVLSRLGPQPPQGEGDGDAACRLLRRIVEGDADLLRRATEEALAYLQWLSRLAEAENLRRERRP